MSVYVNLLIHDDNELHRIHCITRTKAVVVEQIRSYIITLSSAYPNIEVISEGCNDVIRSEGCGLAYIYIDGEQKAPQKRGHNFVVINSLTGKVILVIK